MHDRCRHLFCIIRKRGGKRRVFQRYSRTLFWPFFFFFLSFPFATRFDILRLAFFPFLSNDLSTDPFFFYNSRAFPIQGGGGWKRPSLFPFLHESRWKLKGCLGGAVEGDVPWSLVSEKPEGELEQLSSKGRFAKIEYNFAILFHIISIRSTLHATFVERLHRNRWREKDCRCYINNGLLHNSPLWSKGKESNPPLLLPNRYGNLTAAKINFEERIGRTMPPMHFLTRNPRSCAMFRDESYISLVSLLGYASLSIFPSMDTNYTRVMCLYGGAITRA